MAVWTMELACSTPFAEPVIVTATGFPRLSATLQPDRLKLTVEFTALGMVVLMWGANLAVPVTVLQVIDAADTSSLDAPFAAAIPAVEAMSPTGRATTVATLMNLFM